MISGLDVRRVKQETLDEFTKVYAAVSKNEKEISELDETFKLLNVSCCQDYTNSN